MNEQGFDIDHFLSDHEVQALVEECSPSLLKLNCRYTPEVDLSQGYPSKPEYLDVVRTKWLLDKAADRPKHQELVNGLGLAFGMLLQQRTPLRWYSARDSGGRFNFNGAYWRRSGAGISSGV